ncbi:MAG: hypothetical protein QM831_42970 [Kofleriaceae bacterium]
MREIAFAVVLSACGQVSGVNPPHEQPDAGAAIDPDGGSDSTPPPDAAPVAVLGCDQEPLVPGTGQVQSWSREKGNITVNYYGDGVHSVDLSKFDAVMSNPMFAQKTWPDSYGTIADMPITINKYVSLEFTVPDGYFEAHPTYYGEYSIGESSFAAPVSMTISEHCGDFGQLQPTTIEAGCVLIAGGPDSRILWNSTSGCKMKSGHRYYLNVINADITSFPATTTQRPAKCVNDQCETPVMNGYGSWSN